MPTPSRVNDEVGEVVHLARSGRLIVKLNTTDNDRIKPGELLIDGSGRKVGKVVELLGPVSSPYASVIPMTDRTSKLAGSKVFNGGFAKMPHKSKRNTGRRSSK